MTDNNIKQELYSNNWITFDVKKFIIELDKFKDYLKQHVKLVNDINLIKDDFTETLYINIPSLTMVITIYKYKKIQRLDIQLDYDITDFDITYENHKIIKIIMHEIDAHYSKNKDSFDQTKIDLINEINKKGKNVNNSD